MMMSNPAWHTNNGSIRSKTMNFEAARFEGYYTTLRTLLLLRREPGKPAPGALSALDYRQIRHGLDLLRELDAAGIDTTRARRAHVTLMYSAEEAPESPWL
jgi:hypothetical protein